MSYDLMVFAKDSAPRNRADFLEWFDCQLEGEDDGEITSDSPAMLAWHQEMVAAFPDMDTVEEEEIANGRCGEYSIFTGAIYVSFAWSQASVAYETMRSLAAKHGVGFFNVSAEDGEIIIPGDGTSGLLLL
ncbi:hypothetical protein [Hymenobacter negativus]|uniref:Integron gene cassette protein n=1 Tax=Hymenobacter negativus TaxID=2795026 RepID=A0ABS3QNQ7_9BACT|nr:hypothetical protein [Hymenobacter negativus]MBO2012920.1 hypothetical protein [Hymenobacter negativus]